MLGVIQRMHSGRSPRFRALAMCQEGDEIVEAAEWLPRRGGNQRYTVVLWKLNELGLSWLDQPSRTAALAVLAARIKADSQRCHFQG